MMQELWFRKLSSGFSDLVQTVIFCIMKEQRSISVPGISLEQDNDTSPELEQSKQEEDVQQHYASRPGTLFEVFMALKERER